MHHMPTLTPDPSPTGGRETPGKNPVEILYEVGVQHFPQILKAELSKFPRKDLFPKERKNSSAVGERNALIYLPPHVYKPGAIFF